MIYFTENDTTSRVGQSIATVIEDSLHPSGGPRLTTVELVYPRFVHQELLTHRAFSRNASSSRATPLSVTLKEVRESPVLFESLGLDKPGMQAGEVLGKEDSAAFIEEWRIAGRHMADCVEHCHKAYHIHKEVLNRALEPWLRIRTLVTATDWDNFFKLRLSPLAQPEMQSLASAIKSAMEKSKPVKSTWHTPYVDPEKEKGIGWNKLILCSVARCARVSYLRMGGKPTDVEKDIALAKQLLQNGHMSPFEHIACIDNPEGRFANFTGFASLRYKYEHGGDGLLMEMLQKAGNE